MAYLRVSTAEQTNGLEAQRAALEAWATRAGIEILAYHTDRGVSGGAALEDRPALVAALSDVTRLGADALVVAKRDRLARDTYTAMGVERTLARSGACVLSADGTANGTGPADEFMRTVIDAAAAYERSLIRARTRAALAAKRARGELVGCAPFGYQRGEDGRTLVPHEREQGVLARARELRASGLSYQAVADRLAAEGAHSRAGTPLPVQQVWKLLTCARECA